MLISFIRHASTDWNTAGRMQGRRDIPLCAHGRAELLGWRLPARESATTTWIASPLRRAVETAQTLCGGAPGIEPALIEMDWGRWEGHRLAELRARYRSTFVQNEQRGLDFRPPGGESPRDVMARVLRWLATIERETAIVVVSHHGVLRSLLSAATGWDMTGKPPVKLRSGALHRFARSPDGALSLVECNVPLVDALSGGRPSPPSPIAPSATRP